MFPRRKRIPAKTLAGKLTGQLIISHFLFRFGKNGLAENRYAVVIGLKFDKSSAKRHYWKRQINERLRLWPDAGLDVAVFPLKEAKKLLPREAVEPIKGAFKKIIK
jgi:RNase P protein component